MKVILWIATGLIFWIVLLFAWCSHAEARQHHHHRHHHAQRHDAKLWHEFEIFRAGYVYGEFNGCSSRTH